MVVTAMPALRLWSPLGLEGTRERWTYSSYPHAYYEIYSYVASERIKVANSLNLYSIKM
jgi:hypothetical protein